MQANIVDVDESSTATVPIVDDNVPPPQQQQQQQQATTTAVLPREKQSDTVDVSSLLPPSSSSAVWLNPASSASLSEPPRLPVPHTVSKDEDVDDLLSSATRSRDPETRAGSTSTPALLPVLVEATPAERATKTETIGGACTDVNISDRLCRVEEEATLRAFIASWSASVGGVCPGMLVFAPHRVEATRTVCSPTTAVNNCNSGNGNSANNNSSVLPPPVRLHYALAEVTGLQSCAGTATVTFLMTDPGVDDEAIPLFELIPCPSTWLTRLGVEASSPRDAHCSLLERVLAVGPSDGPVHPDAAFAQLAAVKTRHESPSAHRTRPLFALEDLYCLAKGEPARPSNTAHSFPSESTNASGSARSAAGAGSSEAEEEAEEPWAPARKTVKLETEPWARGSRGRPDGQGTTAASPQAGGGRSTDPSARLPHRHRVGKDKEVLAFSFEAPQSVHTFFATAFQEVDRAVEIYRDKWASEQQQHEASSGSTAARLSEKAMRRTLWQAQKPPVALCVFDGYSILHRFEVYMSLRGHVVRLLDGDDIRPEEQMMAGEEEPDVSATGSAAGAEPGGARRVCTGPTPVPPVRMAFSSQCKVWLCMMRDDATAGGAVGSASPSLPKLLTNAPPIDVLVVFRETSTQEEEEQHAAAAIVAVAPDSAREEEAKLARAVADKDGADAAIHRLLPHLQSSRGRQLYCCFDHLPPEHGTAGKVVKVSGSLFGANKVLVPASREQLLLAATVWTSANNTTTTAVDKSSANSADRGGGLVPPTLASGRGSGDGGTTTTSAAAASSVLSPALLERIALGTFTDSSAANLFMTYQRTVAFVLASPAPISDKNSAHPPTAAVPVRFSSIRDLRDAFYRDASRFGEVFPIFAAARALMEDIFADWQRIPPRQEATHHCHVRATTVKREHTDDDDPNEDEEKIEARVKATSIPHPPHARPVAGTPTDVSWRPPFPRIALVFPRGNPTGNPLLMVRQFLHNLRQYMTPWMLYEVALPCDGSQTAVPVLWSQRGGVLLLHCDEPSAQLGAVHHEADVVISCGKAASAWVAANAVSTRSAPAATTTTGVTATRTVGAAGMRSLTQPLSTRRAAPLYFAVLSEVEVVTEVTSHVWVPYASVDVSRDAATTSAAIGATLFDGAVDDALGLRVAQSEAEKAWRQLQETVGVLANGAGQPPLSHAGSGGGEASRRRSRRSDGSGTVAAGTAAGASTVGGAPMYSSRLAQEYEAMPKIVQQAVLLHQHLDQLARRAGASQLSSDGPWSAWHHAKAFTKSLALNAAAAQPITLHDIVVGTI